MTLLMLSSQSGTLLRGLPLLPNSELSFASRPHQLTAASATTAAASLSFPPRKSLYPLSLSLNATRTHPIFNVPGAKPSFDVSASVSSQTPTESESLLTGSTRTVSSIVTLGFFVSGQFLNSLQNFAQRTLNFSNPGQLTSIRALQCNLALSVGPLFFSAITGRPSGYLNTPFTVVAAAGLGKWLDIYSGVLMVRVLLSWFPNIPWRRQPFSAIRDLCDPYLNLFRNILPPVFNTIDVSPLLAFAVLGTLGSILRSRGGQVLKTKW